MGAELGEVAAVSMSGWIFSVELIELSPGRFVFVQENYTALAIALDLETWIDIIDPEHQPQIDLAIRFLDQAEHELQPCIDMTPDLLRKYGKGSGPVGAMLSSVGITDPRGGILEHNRE